MAEVNTPQHKRGQRQKNIRKHIKNEHCMINTHSNLKKNLQKPYRSLRKTNGKQMNTMENQRTARKNERKPKESLRKT